MTEISMHEDLLVFLRSILLLGPLFLTCFLGWKYKHTPRFLVGGLFSFLYNLGLLLPAHALAIYFDMWHYGGNTLKLLGMPADLWFAGSFLFGPAIFFISPRIHPFIITFVFIALVATSFKSLDPLVISGNYWLFGIILIFIFVHIPALYLARWTAFDTNLINRSCLLACGYGFLAFFVLPTLIMHAMGGEWGFNNKSLYSYIITMLFLLPCFVMGLTAVHMFVIHGAGTPIPLDKTKYLVQNGIYAYVSNPMQLCSALSWIIIGAFLQNIFVSLAAVMAIVFVLGLVRWHHRNDLQVRFPAEWLEYKENVYEWFPRYKPWIKNPSKLYWNSNSIIQRTYVNWLKNRDTIGLLFEQNNSTSLQYIDGHRGLVLKGCYGLIYPLFHINFLYALLASGFLLLLVPLELKRG